MVGTVVVLELVDVSAVVDEGRTVVVVATVEVVGPDVDAKIVDCLGVPDGRAIVVVGADWRGGGGPRHRRGRIRRSCCRGRFANWIVISDDVRKLL